MFGVEETVDRREGDVGELQVARLHERPDPSAEPAGEPHRDAVLGPPDRRERHHLAGVERIGELGEGPLIDAPHRPPRRLAVQSFGGLDHLLVQAFGQKQPELLGG